jgi:predicted O-linked N-acetylglucosamine transferase (SPINDLY family)/predicted SAM-dependent methyltransferase
MSITLEGTRAPSTATAARAEPRPAVSEVNQWVAQAIRLQQAGRTGEAEALYLRVLEREPRRVPVLMNLSTLLRGAGRNPEARELAERATAADPNNAGAYFALGAALRQLRRDKEAMDAYEKAVEIDPAMARAWVNLAVSAERLDRKRSVEAQHRVLESDPDNLVILNMQLKFMLQECDFDGCERLTRRVLDLFDRQCDRIAEWRILANLAYRALFIPVPPALLLKVTDRIDSLHRKMLAESGPLPPLAPPDPAAAGRRLRLGYMTPNFSDHPVGHVTLQLFPAHDRERFEVHAFATQARRGGDSTYNKLHRHGVDFYHDLSGLPHREMARRIRTLGIDVLIDIDGYMETASTAIMAFRPAPVQIYWMGHAGGLGLSFVDYLLADAIVIQHGEEHLYRERIVRLPECYHVASPAPIAEPGPSRADCGLPADAFVFCAFNNPEKFNRAAFDAWMKILAAVPGSVLWISKVKDVPQQIETLRRQAAERGVDGGRLIFADRLPDKADHYARHRHVGLFLDTLTLNASTTALDTLWAGVPLLAVSGDRFSNRISTTMLTSIGMADMVVDDLDAYVARAIHLATHPDELAALAERLKRNRETTVLFDVPRFARHLEAAYAEMWQRHCRGEAPKAFDVQALAEGSPVMKERQTMSDDTRLQINICGSEPRAGWKILAEKAGPNVDMVADPRTLAGIADDSVDAVYAAWYYQRLSFREELPGALAAAYRVLKPGGTLRIAVPDFQRLCNLMVNATVPKKEKFSLMALMYGDQTTPERHNQIGLTVEFAAAFLSRAGFKQAKRVPSFGLFNDMSAAKRFGHVVSLNIEATK